MSLEQAIAEAMTFVESAIHTVGGSETAAHERKRPFGLTPRELDVLVLIAHHATDREIAEQLSISPRTVMHHVSNVLAKLGVTHRRAAAVTAMRSGLA
jgi:DNA-binding NarL/FixJ family response regulator